MTTDASPDSVDYLTEQILKRSHLEPKHLRLDEMTKKERYRFLNVIAQELGIKNGNGATTGEEIINSSEHVLLDD